MLETFVSETNLLAVVTEFAESWCDLGSVAHVMIAVFVAGKPRGSWVIVGDMPQNREVPT